jgi:hypothetical protein
MHGRLVVGMVRRMRDDLRIDQATEQQQQASQA